MKKTLLSLITCFSLGFAVDGYKDIYLDREKDIKIHSIFCGKDLKNVRALKQAYIYTNTANIEKGIYYYSSGYGNFTYTFNHINGQPDSLLARGILKNGETNKNKMIKEVCIVKPIQGLPPALNSKIKQAILKKDDPNWDKQMKMYAMVAGKPAFAKGVYKDSRSAKKSSEHNKKVHDALQRYLKNIETKFDKDAEKIFKNYPKKIKDAVKYAIQEDGFVKNKKYPIVKEPQVWTPTSKKRYESQVKRVNEEKQFDYIIQKNFDWLFNQVGKNNNVKNITRIGKESKYWDDNILKKKATYKIVFNNNKTLELDFTVASNKVDKDYFLSLEKIEKISYNRMNDSDPFNNKPLPIINPKDTKAFKVYDPSYKMHLFFSLFREKKKGTSYR